MSTLTYSKQAIQNLAETLQESQLAEVYRFMQFVKNRDTEKLGQDLQAISESSTDFWYNDVDDEVWNDV
ncbi:MAG: DUF2281 domain-containing protein [Defluviitaleaceae bacterium]|nr:DUF2281 domain-containing protein [Defluviitaleaceae bacterium]